MKHEPLFLGVMERLKEALRLGTDAEIARVLKMSPTAFNNRKRAGSIPYSEIIALAVSRNIDIGTLLGLGRTAIRNPDEGPGQSIDHEVLAEIIHQIDLAFGGVNLGYLSGEETLMESRSLAYFCAVIYKRTAVLSAGQTPIEQSRAIRHYAQAVFKLIHGASAQQVRDGTYFHDFARARVVQFGRGALEIVNLIEQSARLSWELATINSLRTVIDDPGQAAEIRTHIASWDKYRVNEVLRTRLELVWEDRDTLTLEKGFFDSLQLGVASRHVGDKVKETFHRFESEVAKLVYMAMMRQEKHLLEKLGPQLLNDRGTNDLIAVLTTNTADTIDKYYKVGLQRLVVPGGGQRSEKRGVHKRDQKPGAVAVLGDLFDQLRANADTLPA